MRGDDRVRLCSKCDRHVYNISQMSREEAVQLIEENGDQVCVRFYQRADGTILTRPCGGAKRLAYRWKMAGLTALAVIAYPACTPVYAGAAISPRSMFKMHLRRVQMYNEELREAKDPAERETLTELKSEEMKRLRKAFERMDPEDIEELAPLKIWQSD